MELNLNLAVCAQEGQRIAISRRIDGQMASDRLRGNSASKIVVFDSSAILMLFEYSINLEEELIRLLGNYEIVVPSKIVEELKIFI